MRYQGGKSKFATWIVNAIADDLGTLHPRRIVEPFMGGGAVTYELRRKYPDTFLLACDAMPGLANLHSEVVAGWRLAPRTEADYQATRRAGWTPSPEHVAMATALSWGGRYGKGCARPFDVAQRRFANWCARWQLAHAGRPRDFREQDYRVTLAECGAGDLVYCDPPYAGTAPYAQCLPFDSSEFWALARTAANRGARVYVSEWRGVDGARIVAQRVRKRQINKANEIDVCELLLSLDPVS